MNVEVRPVQHKKWHGKKDGESFAQPKVIEALFDESTGGYATGLTEEEEKKYGELLGANLSSRFRPDEAHPYYGTKAGWVYLPNHTLILNDEKPADYVKIKLMKASRFVANSLADLEQGKFPDATHVIFDETEEVQLKATKVQRRNRAIGYLPKMSAEAKIDVVMVLSEKSIKGQTQDFIDVEIDDIINNKTEEFLNLMELGPEEVKIRSKIHEMTFKNIITKEGGSYMYMGELIGMDFKEVVSFFKDPNNQRMKLLMYEKLEKK